MDFETFSEVDLGEVGACNYSLHPSTEVLCLTYNLRDDRGPRLWVPGAPAPRDLFEYLAKPGALIEAWNVAFEFWIWENVCRKRMGWPTLPEAKLRCAMAKARAWGLPGKLKDAGTVLVLRENKNGNSGG